MTTDVLTADQARVLERQVEAAVWQQPGVTDCAVVCHGTHATERRCVRCGITDAFPGLTLDAAGVCSLCTRYATHHDEIHAWFRGPDQLVPDLRALAGGREGTYDCLLLYSGGKDSTYVLYQLVDLGLKVMTFTFDNGFISRTALDNVARITAELGIEHVTATRAGQRGIFLQSLRDHKSVCNGCFRSLLDLSTELASERGIPAIVTGLSRGQIMDERLSWCHEHGIYDVAEIEEKLAQGRRVYHQSAGGIDPAAVDAVRVVDYFRYSDVTKDGIREFLRRRSSFWAQPGDTGFCSSNCMINDVGVYVHATERGYHNYEAPTRWEVRLGHLAVAEADEELRAPVDTARVRRMLARIGYPDPADHDRLGARLTAYYVGGDGVPAAVATVLPASLVPGEWVPVDRIPRTAGEVDRSALAALRTAGRAGSRAPEAAGLADDTRPLLPAQRHVLDHDPAAHARALLVEPGVVVDPAALRTVVLRLHLHHDALRMRFQRRGDGWRRRSGGVGRVGVSRVDATGATAADEARLVTELTARMRARLDPSAGPLLRIALLDRGTAPSGLLVVVHELVADVASWRILLTDLATGLRGADLPAAAPVDDGRPGAPPVSPAAQRVAEWLAGELHGSPVAVLDHTTGRADRVVGPLSDVDDVDGVVRYEHFGDLSSLAPPGWRVAGGDFVVPHPAGRTAVAGIVRDGALTLDWWRDPHGIAARSAR
jgi:predicted Fe-S protein YdhL (DUF1289 family)